MKLVSVKVTNFRSIEDSQEIAIGDLTCLVGKNEAGKSALLQALYGLNPAGEYSYDRLRDYPRRHVNKFDDKHPDGKAQVIATTWELGPEEIAEVEEKLGENCLESNRVVYSNGFGYTGRMVAIQLNENVCTEWLISKHKLDASEKKPLKEISTTKGIAVALESTENRSDKQNALLKEIVSFRDKSARSAAIDTISSHLPKFLYTTHFERMSGEISVDKLTSDRNNKQVSPGDKIFLDFLEYAGTSLEELKSARQYEHLKAQCEGASNEITEEIFEFWSQNEALSVQIELSEGKPDDKPPFNSGTVAKIRIHNAHHKVSVPLSERSAGFVWFFSFLSQFKQFKKNNGSAILLLDEPGLTLHGKAQSDLLKYIQERLLPEHQVIYTTHSPFMVPAERLGDVRVVEDVLTRDGNRTVVRGTKVSADILSVDRETLFPLQGHLGYEITQSLFIGKDTLLVEGPSDILYLQSFSHALKKRGREGLDGRWTICPSGGIDKVWPFASLFGGNKLNIAVLCDYGSGDKVKVERLRQSQILKSSQIFTASDFSGKAESDIEDFITEELYAHIVNLAFELPKAQKLKGATLNQANSGEIRIVKAAEAAFRTMPPNIKEFDHFTPAYWLLTNSEVLDKNEPMVNDSLDNFEAAFKELNKLISKAELVVSERH
jgi:predicted ATPase